jgi:hypothetical protein
MVIQLLVANVSWPVKAAGVDVPANLPLQIARLLLPLVAAYTTIRFVALLAHQNLSFLRMKLLNDHIVFLGAGRAACSIASRIQTTNHRTSVIALDILVSSKRMQFLQEKRNVQVVKGDATDPSVLKRLNLAKASEIYIFTGNDQRDLDILYEVVRLIPDHGRKPDLHVDIDDKSLVRTANLSKALWMYQANHGKLRWFSSQAQTARMLFLTHPPKRASSGKQDSPVHVGVIGMSPLAQEIVLQAIRHCVYFDMRPISVSIFAKERSLFEQFLLRHPVLDSQREDAAYGGLTPIVKIDFYTFDPASSAPAPVREATPLSIVYATGETDQVCQIASYRFRQALMVTGHGTVETVCCLGGTHYTDVEEALAEQRDSDKNIDFYQNITLFHTASALFGANEESPGSDADRFGIHVDAAYTAIGKKENKELFVSGKKQIQGKVAQAIQSEFIEAMTKWETELAEDFRWSSRHAGDHLFVKLRELGFSLQAGNGGISAGALEELQLAIEAKMDSLKRVEHRRFCLERLLDGWLYFDQTRKPAGINNTLIAFDKLSDQDKDKDEAIIRAIPVILRDVDISSRYTLTRVSLDTM